MRILFEEYNYDTSEVKDILGNLVLSGLDMAKSVQQLRYVGYFFNKDIVNSDGSKGDLVFILPKVLLDKDGSVFSIDAKKLINFNYKDWKNNELVVEGGKLTQMQVYDFIYSFAIWIYRALSIYGRKNSGDDNVSKVLSSVKVGLGGQKKEVTFVDIMLSLLDFQHTHRNFILFVMKMAHSGFHKVSWPKTIARTQPFMQDGVPIYINPINKKRVIDFDEELIIIYYSILNYMHDEYGFPSSSQPGYELIRGAKFKGYLDGRGKTRLHQIRYKYYSDDAVLLWNLCYAFFDKSSELKGQTNRDDYLLVNKFETVFEGMIDELIGNKGLPKGLKVGADDKRIDHIYTYKYLLENIEPINEANKTRDIYHIADSKYYRRDKELHGHDVPKQFTYARNVVQWHMDLLHDLLDDDVDRAEEYKEIPMFDDVTEGYNIIPNFFISALVDEDLNYDNDDFKKTVLGDVEGKGNPHESYIFWERLFDRSTYFTLHYDVNFLFVLKKYAQNRSSEKTSWREEVRNKFREGILEYLNEQFEFYQIIISEKDIVEFVERHFRKLNGKVFSFEDVQGKKILLYAERKDQNNGKDNCYKYNEDTDTHVLGDDERVDKVLIIPIKNGVSFDSVKVKKLNKLGKDSYYKCINEPQSLKVYKLYDDSVNYYKVAESASSYDTHLGIDNHTNDFFLIGCYKNLFHLDWINKMYKYNVRLGDRIGAVNENDVRVKMARFLVLYNYDNPHEYQFYSLESKQQILQKIDMIGLGYPNPLGDTYYLYHLNKKLSVDSIDIQQLLKDNHVQKGSELEGAPVYLMGNVLMQYLNPCPSPKP